MAAGWSQNYLASELGIDLSTYARYESGETEIKLTPFLKLLKLYGIKPFKIFENYILNDKIELIEDPQLNYGKKIAESEITINHLNNTISNLRKDIDLLKELNNTKEENIRLLKQILKEKKGET